MIFLLQWLEDINIWVESLAYDKVKEWPLMYNIYPILSICLVYFILVKYIGPKLMENRPAYSLKDIIIYYNIFQVIVCAMLVTWILSNRPTTFGCVALRSIPPEEKYVNSRILWWTTLLKMVELVETVFFVLRKKQNQVSFLHVYHHISTLIFIWAAAKMFPSKMIQFPIMLNCFIHVLMYTYYLMSVIGNPKFQEIILKLKRYLTILQMIQFACVVLYVVQLLTPSCEVPTIYLLLFLPNMFIITYLFYKFYQEAYLETEKNE